MDGASSDPAERFAELNRIASSFDLTDVIRRYCDDFQRPLPIAVLHARELLRYFVLNELSSSRGFPMAGAADDFWHVFLLFTRRYAEFSHLLSGRFLHHEPSPPNQDTVEVAQGMAEYREFLQFYERMYGEAAPHEVWPRFTAEFRARTAEFKVLLHET